MVLKRLKRKMRTRSQPGPSPRVPAGTRVYAIGDSHGCADELRALHEAILHDSARADGDNGSVTRQVVVYLGDYVDRGPDSRGVLDLLIKQPLPGFQRVHLMGNHEAFMRQFLDGEDMASVWMMNGGAETLRSYGVGRGQPGGAMGASRDLLVEFENKLPKAHRIFLDGLELSHEEGDYLFVHAGIRPGQPIEAQDPHDLLWIREPFLGSKADHGKIVVHGHSPAREPDERPNRIGIDTGACYGGYLTALVLEGSERQFLQV